jgi:hypothetical protein
MDGPVEAAWSRRVFPERIADCRGMTAPPNAGESIGDARWLVQQVDVRIDVLDDGRTGRPSFYEGSDSRGASIVESSSPRARRILCQTIAPSDNIGACAGAHRAAICRVVKPAEQHLGRWGLAWRSYNPWTSNHRNRLPAKLEPRSLNHRNRNHPGAVIDQRRRQR